MRQVKVWLENMPGVPYSQSARHDTPFLERESHEDYERRTWLEKCTTNREGVVCIPAMGLKQCIDTAAFKLGLKITGRRGATFKSFFASGFFCDENVPLQNGKSAIKKTDAAEITILCHSTGKRGSGSRVPRTFPMFNDWHAVASFTILDNVITEDIFERHVVAGGLLVGIGRFRPENGGINGRFKATKFEWTELEL